MGKQTKSLEEITEMDEVSNDFLEVMGGPEDGRVCEINRDKITIGRQGDRDFVLSLDGSISRVHAEVQIKDGKYFIKDCNSLNGTWIAGKQIKPEEEMPLEPDQLFRLGDVKLRLCLKKE